MIGTYSLQYDIMFHIGMHVTGNYDVQVFSLLQNSITKNKLLWKIIFLFPQCYNTMES